MIRIVRQSVFQLFRYGVVGLISNLIIYLLYLFFTYFGTEPKLAMTIVYLIGASISFFGNKSFTFNDKGGVFDSIVRYIMIHILGYLLNLSVLIVFVDKLGYSHQIVQGIAIFLVAAFLFVSFKWFVFKDE